MHSRPSFSSFLGHLGGGIVHTSSTGLLRPIWENGGILKEKQTAFATCLMNHSHYSASIHPRTLGNNTDETFFI